MTLLAALLSCLALLGWLYLGFFHGRFWQILVAEPAPLLNAWPSVDIIVPARNEAKALPHSLPSLLAQDYPGTWRVILVDDHSADGTSAVAQKIATEKNLSELLMVISAPALPPEWSGKLAAMQAGVAQSAADYVLFTDADIEHPQDGLRKLVMRAEDNKLDLTSLMVKLHCASMAEKFLVPAFVFFFAMLYPFRRANNPQSRVTAAAGGVMLVRRSMLDAIGGLASIKSALIDDCTLAKAIKDKGGCIEITLARTTKSLRVYPRIKDIWRMVARTAYTQLRHSRWLLAGTVIGMGILFLLPPLMPLTGWPLASEAALGAWLTMFLLYLPMVRFYDLPFYYALFLPFAALIYIAATIDSARLYWQGKGGQWKGRSQA